MSARSLPDLRQLDAGDDPQVADGAVAERRERRLVAGAVVGGLGGLQAVELDDDGARLDPVLIDDVGDAPRQNAPAARRDGRAAQARIGGQLGLVKNFPVAVHPIGLRHGVYPSLI